MNRGRWSRRAFLSAAAALASSRMARAADPSDGLLARIARARAPVRTMRGPFTQARTIGLLATEVRSRGTLTLVRPDRLRWELDPPDAVTFWIGPEGLAYRSAHDHGRVDHVTAQNAAALDDVRTLLGGDLAGLRERWKLRVVRDDASGAELEAEARTPLAGGPHKMTFSLAPDLVRPTHVALVLGARDRTTIDFGDLAVNVAVDEASMRPPP